MSTKIKYRDEPLGELEIVEDVLPAPEELAFEDETVKITIALSKSSVEFFKEKAALYDTSYQKMIRRLLDTYAKQHRRASGS